MHSFVKEVEKGRSIARRAGEIALRYWGKGIAFENKADESPVTVADREAEQFIARAIVEEFPDDGLLGEEGSAKGSGNGRRWIIDPVDGTRDFVRGNPAWAVLLGFEAEGQVRAGFAYFPAVDQMFWAAAGGGVFLGETAIRVSTVTAASRAVLCINGLNEIGHCSFAPRLAAWMEQFWTVRSMGGCLDAVMVARGQADLWIEPTAKPWDLAPLKVIAEEAGGRFFNFDGGSSIYGGNCIICTPGLEIEARRLLAPGAAVEA